MTNNKFCGQCVKVQVCEWNKKIIALDGTDKKPILLDVTINNCEEFLSSVEDE